MSVIETYYNLDDTQRIIRKKIREFELKHDGEFPRYIKLPEMLYVHMMQYDPFTSADIICGRTEWRCYGMTPCPTIDIISAQEIEVF